MKLFNAKKVITVACLWKKFEDCRKEIRTLYTHKLPSDLLSIPSGQHLRDVYKKFIVDRFGEEDVSSCCLSRSLVRERKPSIFLVVKKKTMTDMSMKTSSHSSPLTIG